MEIPRSCIQHAQQWREIRQPMRDQVTDAFHVLPLPFHRKQPRLKQWTTLRFGHPSPHDDVDQAMLVLQRHEDDAAGGLRLLPRRHQPGHAHAAVVWLPAQCFPVDATRRVQPGGSIVIVSSMAAKLG